VQILVSGLKSSDTQGLNVSIDTEGLEPCPGERPGMAAATHGDVERGHRRDVDQRQPVDPSADEWRR
jgi:hypothetical protein